VRPRACRRPLLDCLCQVRHDQTVTWLAYWKDPINPKEYKYVWLAANSSFKSESDLAKCAPPIPFHFVLLSVHMKEAVCH
jgi:Eukaryotic DNA topoisomerase I, DNA binding fragment